MQMQVRTEGFRLTEAIHDHVQQRLRHALERFAHAVQSVRVRLRDENGPRGGIDKRCHVEVVLRGRPPMHIDERGTDLYAAIGRGADRAERQVARAVERRRRFATGGAAAP